MKVRRTVIRTLHDVGAAVWLGDQLESLIRRHRVLDKFATSWAELGTTVGRELRDQVGVSIPNS